MPNSIEAARQSRRRGAILSVLTFAAVQLVSATLLFWGAALLSEFRWLQLILWCLAVLCLIPLPFAGIALNQRLKEIKGGEHDASSQY